MRKLRKLVQAWPLLLLALLAACRHGSPKLEGHWRGVRAEGVAEPNAIAFAASTEIIAQGDKIAIQTKDGRSPTTTYVVDREDATTLVIHTAGDLSGETFTFNEKADTMTWRIDGTRTIVFKKVP